MVQTHGPSTDSSLPRGVGTCLEPQNVPRGFSPGAPWEAEGEGISVAGEGWVMSVRQPQEEKKKPCDGHMGTWGQCSPHTHPLLRGCAGQGMA